MTSFFEELRRFGADEPRAVLATLVATRGTSPRKEGARMWVGGNGRILGSVTIGGCVDTHVLNAAEEALQGGGPRLLSVDLGDEDAHAMGLTCAGAVDVLVQALDLRGGPWREAIDRLRDRVEAGGRAVIATVLPGGAKTGDPHVEEDVARAAPVTPAGPIVIDEDGTLAGTSGDAALDARIAERAHHRLRLGGAGVEVLPGPGGELSVWLEAHGRGPLLAVIGGGPIAAELARFGRALGQYVAVIDGRPRFADPAQFPDAHEVRSGSPAGALAEMRIDASSSIVLVAHDYKFDLPVLRFALAGDAGYIGMLGSRKRVAAMRGMLEEEGVSSAALDRVHAPIGLDIGGRSAAEIALSIAAEIVAVRNGRTGGSMRSGR